MEATIFSQKKKKEIARVRINTRKTCDRHPARSTMAFENSATSPRKTIRRTARRVTPMSLTKRVQTSVPLFNGSYVAFKIVPPSRLPQYILSDPEVSFVWGAQLVFSGGILGSLVVEDLAKRTPDGGVRHTSWDMPALAEGEKLTIFSVMVRSTGDAERFPADMLMLLHAPDLAGQTSGAHVFHFLKEDESMQFQSLLLSRMLDVRD